MKFVAVTSCPTGIAHTYMAAESLEQAALEAGHEIVVETQQDTNPSPYYGVTLTEDDYYRLYLGYDDHHCLQIAARDHPTHVPDQ